MSNEPEKLVSYRRANQKNRNRLRLISLFSIYPVYKAIDSYNKGDMAVAVIMTGTAILYLLMMLALYTKGRK